ncbi:Lysyl-tRNA synthetase (class I) [Minicystis rosea]|nr:Lysyl-tRNA synthetase (class I) [Minicystis rosea]
MLWFADLAASIDRSRPHVINDSKTPSGRVHVGALRGVILHDAVFRALKSRDIPVRYLYGVDDYDPLDEIPKGQDEHFVQYLGQPLCNVPPPPGSSAPDMAEHFMIEFYGVFDELGVEVERYRLRDLYRSGKMNESIDAILKGTARIKQIYDEVSGPARQGTRGEQWHPFQVICEVCKRIGTTEVVAYDGKEVEYHCRPHLVKWAKGCGHHGKMSPFDGNGKMPWKLEWVAKWRTLGVTIEGAGKDHTTKGGSRDVANACFEALFGGKAPLNIPYEFFLSKGKKMSSSKGVGTWARDMADFLAPEVLRYLILRTQPQSPVDFPLEPNPQNLQRSCLDEEFVVKLFNDFDRLKKRVFTDPKIRDDEKELYRLCETHREGDFFEAPFQLVLTYVQMPHVDLAAEMEKRKGSPLTDAEKSHLAQRAKSARFWLENFAREEEKTTLQEKLPARAEELSQVQRGFLQALAAAVKDAEWKEDVLQAKVFDTARRTPIAQAQAFQSIYRIFFDKPQGPPAGALMSVLPKDFVLERLAELPVDEAAFWQAASVTPAQVDATLAKEEEKIASVKATLVSEDRALIEVTHADGKVYAHRVSGPSAKDVVAKIG